MQCRVSKLVQTNRTKSITVGLSPTQKKRTAESDSLVGYLGLEIFSDKSSTTRVSQRPIDSVVWAQ